MAANTYTATTGMNNAPRAHHVGVTAVAFRKALGASQFGTVGDSVLLCKIPNKATLLSFFVRGRGPVNGTAQMLLRVGATAISGTMTTVNTTIAGWSHASGTTPGVLPLKVSLSDDAAVQHAVLNLFVSTGVSSSISASYSGYIEYMMDEMDGM